MRSLLIVVLVLAATAVVGQTSERNRLYARKLNDLACGPLKLANPDSAIQLLQQAVALDSMNTAARTNLAGQYVQRHEYALASKQLQEVVRIKPAFAEIVFWLGVIEEQLGRLGSARTHYLRSVKLYDDRIATGGSNLVANRVNRAVALLFLGRKGEAKREIDILLPNLPPDDSMIPMLKELDRKKWVELLTNCAP